MVRVDGVRQEREVLHPEQATGRLFQPLSSGRRARHQRIPPARVIVATATTATASAVCRNQGSEAAR